MPCWEKEEGMRGLSSHVCHYYYYYSGGRGLLRMGEKRRDARDERRGEREVSLSLIACFCQVGRGRYDVWWWSSSSSDPLPLKMSRPQRLCACAKGKVWGRGEGEGEGVRNRWSGEAGMSWNRFPLEQVVGMELFQESLLSYPTQQVSPLYKKNNNNVKVVGSFFLPCPSHSSRAGKVAHTGTMAGWWHTRWYPSRYVRRSFTGGIQVSIPPASHSTSLP